MADHVTSKDIVKRLRDLAGGAVARSIEEHTMAEAANDIELLRAALKGLSDLYSYAWDRVDGGLMMMPEGGVPKFEAAHKAALIALGVEVYDGD